MIMSNDVKEYSVDLQTLFLQFLVSDKELLSRCQNVLDGTYFTRSLQQTADFVKEYANKYSECPSADQIKAVTGTSITILHEAETQSHKEWFLEEFEQFSRHKALEKAILQSADLLDKQRYGEVEKLIKDASNIGLPKSFGTDYFADPRGRLEALKSNNGQVSTGWKSIDAKLYGGFNRGELNIFAAPSGGGKSLFLQNLGLAWSQQGFNGVYFSLELSEGLCSKRIDSMLTGVTAKDIYKNLDDVDLQVRMAGKKAGRFQIVQLTAGATVNDLKSWLKEFQIHSGLKMDYVIVDYLDLMTPVTVKVSAENLFIKDKYVSEELRGMATEGNYLFCTASQLNRGAVESVEFDHSHISGGLSKIQTADNVIGIFNSISMRERQRVQIQFMKTRNSNAVGTKVELQFNTDTLRITDLDEDADAVPTDIDVRFNQLKRQQTTEGMQYATERASPRPGLDPFAKKPSGDAGLRIMDSATTSKLANILKKS